MAQRGQRERSERVIVRAQPRQRPDSERHERPDSGRQQSGDQQEPEPGAADRGRLDQDHRRDQRGGEDERHRGEAPGGRDQHQRLRRRVAASQADHQPRRLPRPTRSAGPPGRAPARSRSSPARPGPLPARSSGPEGPPADRPFAGICPPSPGRRVIASATISAPTARTGATTTSAGRSDSRPHAGGARTAPAGSGRSPRESTRPRSKRPRR